MVGDGMMVVIDGRMKEVVVVMMMVMLVVMDGLMVEVVVLVYCGDREELPVLLQEQDCQPQ